MSNVNPKFCAECGATLAAGAKFCPECGTKTAAAQSAAASSQAAATSAEPAVQPMPTPAAPAAAAAPVAASTPAAKDPASGPSKRALLDDDDDDDDKEDDDAASASGKDDRLGDPDAAPPAKKPLPAGLITLAGLALVIAGVFGYIFADEGRKAAFQKNILGMHVAYEDEQAKLAKIAELEAQQEQDLLVPRSGSFGLSFSPDAPDDGVMFRLSRKRYEEDRRSYVARVSGSVACDDKGGCPTGYDCQSTGTGADAEKKCQAKDGKGDNRVLKETMVGDLTLGKPDAAGLSKATVSFVTEEEWRKRHPPGTVRIEVPMQAPPGGWPVSTDGKEESHVENKVVDEVVTYWPQPKDPDTKATKKINLPVDLQELPLMQKEQCAPISADKDAKCERLTAERIKEIEKKKTDNEAAAAKAKEKGETPADDPTVRVRTSDLSTYTYEVSLWANGYKRRNVLFYEEPAPPDVDLKKLETEGWTVRKFKRTPDGRLVIDNASFDLTPEPATLRTKYLAVLKALKCRHEAPDFKSMSDVLKADAEDRLKEEMFFNKDKWAIAIENEKDAAWVAWKDKEVKAYDCKKAQPQ